MNNRQIAVLAAATYKGGSSMTSVADMLEDSRVIEQYLNDGDERDGQLESRTHWMAHD